MFTVSKTCMQSKTWQLYAAAILQPRYVCVFNCVKWITSHLGIHWAWHLRIYECAASKKNLFLYEEHRISNGIQGPHSSD